MAGASEKKAKQLYEWYFKTYLSIVSGLYIFYILVRVIWCWDSFKISNFFGFLFLTIINAIGIKFLFGYLKLGHPRTSYSMLEEFLWVNWAIMFLTVFSDYFWLLYLSVPGYLGYTYGGTVLGFIWPKSQQNFEQEQVPEQPQATSNKKQKIRYVRA